MNEQQLDAPGPRREVVPSEAYAIICLHPNRSDGRCAHRDAAGGIEGVEGQ
jgi:hypothetical protein